MPHSMGMVHSAGRNSSAKGDAGVSSERLTGGPESRMRFAR